MSYTQKTQDLINTLREEPSLVADLALVDEAIADTEADLLETQKTQADLAEAKTEIEGLINQE